MRGYADVQIANVQKREYADEQIRKITQSLIQSITNKKITQ